MLTKILINLRQVIHDAHFSKTYWSNWVETKWNDNCKDVTNIEHKLDGRNTSNNTFVV